MTKKLLRRKADQCSEYGHQSCPKDWSYGSQSYTCNCECHKPDDTCCRCGATGLAWADAPQLGFRRQRLLVPTLFQPFVRRVEVRGVCAQTSDRHVCGHDAEAERYEYLENWLFEQYDEEQERRCEMGKVG